MVRSSAPEMLTISGRRFMRKIQSLALGVVLALVGTTATFAQAKKGPGDEMKDAGKATGRAAKKTGHKVKKGSKKAAHKTADAAEKGADKVKDATK
jgi:hypothetical protein